MYVTELIITIHHQSISTQNSNYPIVRAYCRKLCLIKGKGSHAKPHVPESERKLSGRLLRAVVGSLETTLNIVSINLRTHETRN